MCGITYLKCPHIPKGSYRTDNKGRDTVKTNLVNLGIKRVPKRLTIRTLHENGNVTFREIDNPDYRKAHYRRYIKVCEDCIQLLESGKTVTVKDTRDTSKNITKQILVYSHWS